MKAFKKISIILTVITILTISFATIGCTDKKEPQKILEFKEEVIVEVNDAGFAQQLLDYYKKYKKNFDQEIKTDTYIENSYLDAMWNTISDKSKTHMQYLQKNYSGKEMDQLTRAYANWILPFSNLAALRAELNWNLIFSTTKKLTTKYKDGTNEQFEILKKDYFKK
ncbi:MAG: hypothetical protein J1E81_10345 [Eubacterium sp.]|nr:hypothetical protein [Eubacterium sp.]